jgi:hypothetical protein
MTTGRRFPSFSIRAIRDYSTSADCDETASIGPTIKAPDNVIE